jgi:hypothetical protein
MIRKFATVSRFRVALTLILLTILVGAATVHAQQAPAQSEPPAQQPPATQPSSSQQTQSEEIGPSRKPKVKDYKNWVFNVGGGASLTNGNTKNFVRGGGGVGAAGVARNYGKYFGLRLDFQFDNLPLRTSALQQAQATSATSQVYSLALDPIINIPVTKVWGGYVLGGASFLHRTGKLNSSTAIPGSACNAFFTWWGNCFNASLPLNRSFLSASQNEFGENFGGGITRKIGSKVEIYGEFRYVHGKHNNITTDFRPITVGVRW